MTHARCLLFDLDGTLTDNYEGISRCVVHALEGTGRDAPDERALRECVGPARETVVALSLVNKPSARQSSRKL